MCWLAIVLGITIMRVVGLSYMFRVRKFLIRKGNEKEKRKVYRIEKKFRVKKQLKIKL